MQNKQTSAREAQRPAPSSRGDHNAKRNEETRGQSAREDFKT